MMKDSERHCQHFGYFFPSISAILLAILRFGSGGYRFEQLDGTLDCADKQNWKVHVVIFTEDLGGLPSWALELGLFYGTIEA